MTVDLKYLNEPTTIRTLQEWLVHQKISGHRTPTGYVFNNNEQTARLATWFTFDWISLLRNRGVISEETYKEITAHMFSERTLP